MEMSQLYDAEEYIYDTVCDMTRGEILKELKSREGFTRDTYQIDTLIDLLAAQRIEEAQDRWAWYDGPQGDD
jgi:hypothetical protein